MKKSLPQSLEELFNINPKNKLVYQWSGAVVVLQVDDGFIFIRRSELMPTHRGQIGFMGGHKSKNEKCPIVTGKREFTEESSISSEYLDILGLLDPVITSNRKVIIPVVANLKLSKEEFFERAVSNGEWDNLIWGPNSYLSDERHWSKGLYCVEKSYPVYFASLSLAVSTYLREVESPYLLWGASAKMVLNFFKS